MLVRLVRRPLFLVVLLLAFFVTVGCREAKLDPETTSKQINNVPAVDIANALGSESEAAVAQSGSATAVQPVDNTPMPTVEVAATPPPEPTMPPTASKMPSPTATDLPTATATPLPTPTPTPIPVPIPEWLAYLNRFRAIGNLPALSDHESTTLGSRLHSRYMVGNDEPTAHYEEEEKPFYDAAGDQAARNSNLFATSQMEADYIWSINFWVSAPFHLIGILDPNLEVVGFGEYKEAVGDTQMAAVLDIGSHPDGTENGVQYPIMFPGDGSETWVVRHSLFEWPYPFDGCPGFATPTGAPVVILLGDGSKVPNVTSHRFARGDEILESCLFDETSYRNNDPYAEKVGREILAHNDAVVIMPRNPLIVGETYTAQVTADGQTYTWQFGVRRGPDG